MLTQKEAQLEDFRLNGQAAAKLAAENTSLRNRIVGDAESSVGARQREHDLVKRIEELQHEVQVLKLRCEWYETNAAKEVSPRPDFRLSPAV
jgi:hypothetical protein